MKKWKLGNLLILATLGALPVGMAEAAVQTYPFRQTQPPQQYQPRKFRPLTNHTNTGRTVQQAGHLRGGHQSVQPARQYNPNQHNPIQRTAFQPRQDSLQLQAPTSLSNQQNLVPQKRHSGGLHYSDPNSLGTTKIVKGSSQLIEVDFDFQTIMIEDQKIISGFPMSARKFLIRGLEPGVSAVTVVSGDKRTQKSFNISVENDVRQLQAVINQSFPTANIVVSPLKSAVILRGTVPTPEMVTQIKEVAKRFSPEVMQNIKIAGAQNVGLQMKVYEISRTKLRQFGVDWSIQGPNGFAIQTVSQLFQGAANATNAFTANGGDFRAGIIKGSSQFFTNIRLLEQHDVAKLVDEPFLVTLNGRPANFLGGGEIPIVVNAGLGVASIEFRPFGTKVDVLPFVLGDGRIKLDLQYEISQVAEGLSGDTDTPGFLVRRANGAVVMRAGHSLVIAGHSQLRRTNTKRGIPGLMHFNWGGALFRDNQELDSEVELLIVATPHFVGDVDPSQLPVHAPGQNTKGPSNAEYYIRGYHEVPNVGGNMGGAGGCNTGNCGPTLAPSNHAPNGSVAPSNIPTPSTSLQRRTLINPQMKQSRGSYNGPNPSPVSVSVPNQGSNSNLIRTPYSQQTRPNGQIHQTVPPSRTTSSIFRPLKFGRN